MNVSDTTHKELIALASHIHDKAEADLEALLTGMVKVTFYVKPGAKMCSRDKHSTEISSKMVSIIK